MNSFNEEFNRLLVATYRSILKVEELMLRDLSGNDLTISEMHMLESIGQSAGMHITDIAQEQGITLPSVTTAIQKLERKGYVIKERNAFDARRVRVRLTEKGRRAEIAHRYFHRQMIRAVLKDMEDAERKAALAAVSKLNAFLNECVEVRQGLPEGSGK